MPIIITLKDIEEAIDNLNYKSETTLKSKLIRAVKNFYQDESSIGSLKSIDTEELVKSVWETGDDPELIKSKRKNFSSIKSSVNTDLKKLYSEGKNPQGIIVGHNNIFDISDEAKNKALASIADVFREKGIDTGSRLTEILAALGDILSTVATSSANVQSAEDEISRLKKLIGGISGKLGLSLPDIAALDTPEDKTGRSKRPVTSTDIKAFLDTIGKSGLPEPHDGILKDAGAEAKLKALNAITDILKDKEIDAQTRISKVTAAVKDLLSDAISAAGTDLEGKEAATIKKTFDDLLENIRTGLPAEAEVQGLGADQGEEDIAEGSGTGAQGEGLAKGKGKEATATESGAGLSAEAKGKSLATITDILKEQGLDTQSKTGKIMDALQGLLSEAISSAGTDLNSAEADTIKNLFSSLASQIGKMPPSGTGGDDASALIAAKEKGEGGDGVGLAEGKGKEHSDTETGAGLSAEAKLKALNTITDILKEQGLNAQSKTSKIMGALQGLLSEAISSAGTDLNSAEADTIKNLFSSLASQIGKMPPAGTGGDDAAALIAAKEKGEGDDGEGLTQGRGEAPIVGESGAGVSDKGKAALSAGIAELLQKLVSGDQKISAVASSINELLSKTLASAGAGLNAEELGSINNLFGELAKKIEAALVSGQGLDEIGVGKGLEDKEGAGEDLGEITEVAEEDAEVEVVEEIEEPVDEDLVEALEEAVEDELAAAGTEIIEEMAIGGEELASDEVMEEAALEPGDETELIAEELTDEVVEIVEETQGEDFAEAAEGGEASAGTDLAGLAAGEGTLPEGEDKGEQTGEAEQEFVAAEEADYEEIIEGDTILEAAETMSDDDTIDETVVDDNLEEVEGAETIEEIAADEVEEVDELIDDDAAGSQGPSTGERIDGDLRMKAELLVELTAAAKALEKMGPDLNSSIYSEEEIKEKAKLLSEEFDRYLSVREKFYNQHILIKSGDYLVGGINKGKNEFPEQIFHLSEFYVGKFPVTNALFEIFVEKTGYVTTAERYGFGMVYIPRMQKAKNNVTGTESFSWSSQLQYNKVQGACWYHPAGPQSSLYIKRTHPVVQVSLEDACAFAAWTGKRLPTEREWESSMRTFHGYIYPWGNTWRDNAGNLEKSLFGDTTPVDHYLEFANAFGVADALGNVLEWTLDPWSEHAADEESEDNYVVKGASWISDSPVSLTDRQPIYKNTTSNILGFRCIAV